MRKFILLSILCLGIASCSPAIPCLSSSEVGEIVDITTKVTRYHYRFGNYEDKTDYYYTIKRDIDSTVCTIRSSYVYNIGMKLRGPL